MVNKTCYIRYSSSIALIKKCNEMELIVLIVHTLLGRGELGKGATYLIWFLVVMMSPMELENCIPEQVFGNCELFDV